MKKQFLNLGKELSKVDQKQISGGASSPCFSTYFCDVDCTEGSDCAVPKGGGVAIGKIHNGLCCVTF